MLKTPGPLAHAPRFCGLICDGKSHGREREVRERNDPFRESLRQGNTAMGIPLENHAPEAHRRHATLPMIEKASTSGDVPAGSPEADHRLSADYF